MRFVFSVGVSIRFVAAGPPVICLIRLNLHNFYPPVLSKVSVSVYVYVIRFEAS